MRLEVSTGQHHLEAESCGKPRNAATAPTHRLLVIEDEAATSLLITKLAERVGFAVTVAASVEEATGLLRAQRYDCITLDVNLGKGNAVQLVRTLAETARGTPIIIISGSPEWMRGIAESIGIVAHLNILAPVPKPIDFATLRRTLTNVRQSRS